MLHIGIGIILRTGSSIHRLCVFGKEHHLLQRIAIFGMRLAIEDERLSHVIEALTHQSLLYLILDVLHRNIIMDIQMAEDL